MTRYLALAVAAVLLFSSALELLRVSFLDLLLCNRSVTLI